MSNAVCMKCGKGVDFPKIRGVGIKKYRCPACGGELEGYSYRKHGWINSDDPDRYAGKAVRA